MENYFLVTLIIISIIVKSLSELTLNCPKERCSSNGQCVDNLSLCPIAMSCPSDFIKINQFTCSKESKFNVPFVCPDNYYVCWEGTCTKDPQECPSMATCPSSASVRCPDNSCVKSIDDCPKYSDCPNFLPIRCPNGDCRRNLEDCPNIIRCPKEFGILCNDGSCRMTSDQCEIPASQTQCADQSMSRCSDGTCTSSKFLCSTPKTCPEDYVMCWNGSCAESHMNCDKPFLSQSNYCSDPLLVRCEIDGSCKKNINQCATAIICPVEYPVRCWDSSCKEKVSNCPEYQECPEGTIKCNDGSCTTSTCGTHITCSMDAPFKCFDNTCKKNPLDCPKAPDCPSKYPILCWDGSCVANRADCLPPESCPVTEPVKCPDNMCRKSVEECKVIDDCPIGFSRCTDGTCRKKLSDCPSLECPSNMPKKCANGLCVKNSNTCDFINGCPFLKPNRCSDGSCVIKESDCPAPPKCNGSTLRLCPDGSCLPKSQSCPLENGCPTYTPLRCADGSCVDPSKSNCPVAICPLETPYKCKDGLCASSLSSCQSTINYAFTECEYTYYPCADGTCANSPEECRPIFNCPPGTERCNDGSCRVSLELCPIINTCPKTRTYRCQDGSCAFSKDYCLNISGCPLSTPFKCSNSGLCVKFLSECQNYEESFPSGNGCDVKTPIKCMNGKCVSDALNCKDTNECPPGKVYCQNSGTCANRLRDCIKYGTSCPENYVRCLKDGKCKPSYDECINESSCPIKTPFRCIDGTCKRYPHVNNLKDALDSEKYCESGIQCPSYKPYICADGSCVEKSSFCQSFSQCLQGQVRCFDRTCVDSEEECKNPINKCPLKNPILCNISGKCVDSIFECQDVSCPSSAPFKCVNGLCETSPRNCVFNEIYQTSICSDEEVTCYDGSCRKSLDLCPLFPGCTDLRFPFKCPDGSCVKTKAECTGAPTCTQDHKLCEDGLCRKECPAYGGCPNDKPLLCPIGICVKFESECAGISNCPIDSPIRCLDGSCANKIHECKRSKREFIGTDVLLFVSQFNTYRTQMILGEYNEIIGYIYLESDSFLFKPRVSEDIENIPDSKKYLSILKVNSIPSSLLRDSRSTFNETRAEDVYSIFPYADAFNNFTLEYEYTILSPTIEIGFLEPDSYKILNPFILVLDYDFPDKHPKLLKEIKNDSSNATAKILDPLLDVCLGKLNKTTKLWDCAKSNFLTHAYQNYQLTGQVVEPGTYAVIFSPQPNKEIIERKTNFLVKYLVIILISGGVSAVVIFIVLYIFVRIYRYRGKYKESREEAKKYQDRMQELQLIGTSYLGQTVGDNLENIVYTNNPAFKIQKDDIKTHRVEELEHFHESALKRYKVLEKNNENLKANHSNLLAELARLKEYKERLEKNADLDTEVKVQIRTEESDQE